MTEWKTRTASLALGVACLLAGHVAAASDGGRSAEEVLAEVPPDLASRIEAANKVTGTRLLFSEAVRDAAGAAATGVGTVELKGVEQPMPLFTLAD